MAERISRPRDRRNALARTVAIQRFQGEWSEEVHSILQSCTLPNLDVLLPKISSRAEGERFFVLAFADEKGATVLANRIREQFERLPRLNEAA